MPKKTLLFTLPALCLLIGACSTANSDATTRDEDGVVIEGGDVGVLALNVGDCFDDPVDLTTTEGPTEIESVAATPCNQPHDNQAYAMFDLPDGDWPGEAGVNDAGMTGCIDRFEAAVGESYDVSPLAVIPLTPTEAGWSMGDHEILCAVYNLDLSKLTADVLTAR